MIGPANLSGCSSRRKSATAGVAGRLVHRPGLCLADALPGLVDRGPEPVDKTIEAVIPPSRDQQRRAAQKAAESDQASSATERLGSQSDRSWVMLFDSSDSSWIPITSRLPVAWARRTKVSNDGPRSMAPFSSRLMSACETPLISCSAVWVTSLWVTHLLDEFTHLLEHLVVVEPELHIRIPQGFLLNEVNLAMMRILSTATSPRSGKGVAEHCTGSPTLERPCQASTAKQGTPSLPLLS